MKLYLGVTDTDWFRFLKQQPADEINFWRPSSQQAFKVLQPGEPFLFKLKQAKGFTEDGDYVGGVAFFYRHLMLPISEAWKTMGTYNGVQSLHDLQDRLYQYREKNKKPFEPDPTIGCTVLSNPVFFEESDWVPIPTWAKNIVQGKSYSTTDEEGLEIWLAIEERLEKYQPQLFSPPSKVETGTTSAKRMMVADGGVTYGERKVYMRTGQGAFRLLVADHYQRQCAITGESVYVALEAAHIKPVSKGGQHTIQNGLLLRSDLHRLFDAGYLTITPEHEVVLSPMLLEQANTHYPALHQQKLRGLPEDKEAYPEREFLEWHRAHIFLS